MAVNRSRFKRFTGCAAGVMVALYITFEAPLSGMSMNPARTFGSAVIGNVWYGWWIYFTAPVLGMLVAVEVTRIRRGVACGKLTHSEGCFIKCNCHQLSRNS
jgi:aquaporin Z